MHIQAPVERKGSEIEAIEATGKRTRTKSVSF